MVNPYHVAGVINSFPVNSVLTLLAASNCVIFFVFSACETSLRLNEIQ